MKAAKPFRRPWLWLGLWWLAVLAVVVASLSPPPPVELPRHGDKVEHLLAYALLAAGAVQVFRRGAPLWLAGLGLVLLGIGLELAQGAFTATRMADPAEIDRILGRGAEQAAAIAGPILGRTKEIMGMIRSR